MMLKDQIKLQRKKLKFTQQLLADQLNVSRVAVVKWENDTNVLTNNKLMDLAKLFNVPMSEILGEKNSVAGINQKLNRDVYLVPVIGKAQAGAWDEIPEHVELSEVTKHVSFIVNSNFPPNKQYALLDVGDSMDQKVPDGSHAFWVNIDKSISSPENGDLVVAIHVFDDGTMETTVIKLSFALDGITLLPCSNNPEHKPIVMNDLAEGCEVKIKARVIGAVLEF